MKTHETSPSKGLGRFFLAILAFTLLLAALPTLAAERDGTVLFFSLEDLEKELSKPDLSQLYSSFSWRTRQEGNDQDTPIERNYRWGNGLGWDGYTQPSTRPLWGY